ncbi:30S ribosomal protein S31, chloroplastic [Ananas comosus]|uniref:30S ribosomal protein S31, chloroplastic n=1 Tax=Ananas comosus TaxID=4615 RepID=A0A6P5G1E4_ANACO|nr:30S ribosomal protein S31, chloroplastic [Ananas comosus]
MALLTLGQGLFPLPPTAAASFSDHHHASRLSFSFSRSHTLFAAPLSVSLRAAPRHRTLPSTSTGGLVYCGRGDKKTAKGKRFRHSFGNARPRDKKKGRGPPRAPMPPSAPRKDRFDDGEIVKIEIDESLFS